MVDRSLLTLPSVRDLSRTRGSTKPPHQKDLPMKAKQTPAAVLRDQLLWVAKAVSTDPTRTHLRAVYVDADRGAFVATDGHRLHLCKSEFALAKTSISLSIDNVETLIASLKGARDVTADYGPKGVTVRVDRATMLTFADCAPKQGAFPRYDRVIPSTSSAQWSACVDPSILATEIEAQRLASFHAGNRDSLAQVALLGFGREGALAIATPATRAQFVLTPDAPKPIETDRPHVTQYRHAYLRDALQGVRYAPIVAWADLHSPLTIEDSSRLAIVMPIRSPDPKLSADREACPTYFDALERLDTLPAFKGVAVARPAPKVTVNPCLSSAERAALGV